MFRRIIKFRFPGYQKRWLEGKTKVVHIDIHVESIILSGILSLVIPVLGGQVAVCDMAKKRVEAYSGVESS